MIDIGKVDIRFKFEGTISIDEDLNITIENIKACPLISNEKNAISIVTKLSRTSAQYGYIMFPAKSEFAGAIPDGASIQAKAMGAELRVKCRYRNGRITGLKSLFNTKYMFQATPENKVRLTYKSGLVVIELIG